MVNSVTFPSDGKYGYIYQRLEKPEKPENPKESPRQAWKMRKPDVAEELMAMYKDEMSYYRKAMAYYRKHKGEFALECSKNLVGKTFSFSPDKINVLFGPNGCGKTTIIKAIAGNAQCVNGVSKVLEPLDMQCGFFDSISWDCLERTLFKMMGNAANVGWTGNPIYLHNFDDVLRNCNNVFGRLQGGFIQGLEDEVEYLMNVDKKASSGEKVQYIYSKIRKALSEKKSLRDIVGRDIDRFKKGNDSWSDLGRIQEKRFSTLSDYEKTAPYTVLLDEIDKSLDILTVAGLYNEALPQLRESLGCQIITVSHNPLILSDKVAGDTERYNIISVVPEYTEEAWKLLKKLF